MGANVIEKHFTLNRSWKGTDHKFSLEPIGLRKLARDLKRVDLSKGVSEKKILDIEKAAKEKMGKSIYLRHACKAGTILTEKHLVLKTPAKGISPNDFYIVMGKTVKIDLPEETCLLPEHLVW
jgi:N-acetylneuraminate synthase/sialic acid synthase